MADSFDAYYKWLGISPKDQPPHHYRLLAIDLFESDPDVIDGAADRQMAHVRTFQTGQNSALSQRLLNELSAARICLLNGEQKAEYDRQLRQKLAAMPSSQSPAAGAPVRPAGRGDGAPPRSLPQAKPLPVADAPVIVADQASSSSLAKHKRTRKPPLWQPPLMLAASGCAVLLVVAVYFIVGRGGQQSPAIVADTPSKTVAAARPTENSATPSKSRESMAQTTAPARPTEIAAPKTEIVGAPDTGAANDKPVPAGADDAPLAVKPLPTPPPVDGGKSNKLEIEPPAPERAMPAGSVTAAAATAPSTGSQSDSESIEAKPEVEPDVKRSDVASGKPTRVPPPDEAEQRQAKQALLKKTAAAKSPEQKQKLARKFMEESAQAASADATVYALLSQATDLAASCGDLELAWRAIEALDKAFAVDAVDMRLKSLADIAKTAKSSLHCRELIDAAGRLIVSALQAGEAEVVKKTAAQTQGLARKTKDKSLQKDVNARAAAAIRLSSELKAVAAARETLQTMPDDPHGNFVVGHWQLCVEDDWEPALLKLSKGDEASWKKLAADSRPLVDETSDPKLQITAVDAWWDAAEKEPWPSGHYLRLHAVEWYRRALASLKGESRTHVEQRLRTHYAIDEGLPSWASFDGGQTIGDFQRITRGASMKTYVDYDGPIDVTLLARTDNLNIRLVAHGHEVVIWNWELNPNELRVTRPDGSLATARVSPLEPDRWYELHYRITREGLQIAVDGVQVFTENRLCTKFPPAPVGVTGAGDAVIDVKKLVVKTVE